jgi:hypothetical protein
MLKQVARSNVERLIGSIRRDCLDHVIALNIKHLKRILTEYLSCYHYDRTHLGLLKDTPNHRSIQARIEKNGKLIASARVGGLHNRDELQKAA